MKLNKKGFSLAECMIAIALIATVTISAVVVFHTATEAITGRWNRFKTMVVANNAFSVFKSTDDVDAFSDNLKTLLETSDALATDGSQKVDVDTIDSLEAYDITNKSVPHKFTKFEVFPADTINGRSAYINLVDGDGSLRFDYTNNAALSKEVSNPETLGNSSTSGTEALYNRTDVNGGADKANKMYVKWGNKYTPDYYTEYTIDAASKKMSLKVSSITDISTHEKTINEITPFGQWLLDNNYYLSWDDGSWGVDLGLVNFKHYFSYDDDYIYFSVYNAETGEQVCNADKSGYLYIRLKVSVSKPALAPLFTFYENRHTLTVNSVDMLYYSNKDFDRYLHSATEWEKVMDVSTGFSDPLAAFVVSRTTGTTGLANDFFTSDVLKAGSTKGYSEYTPNSTEYIGYAVSNLTDGESYVDLYSPDNVKLFRYSGTKTEVEAVIAKLRERCGYDEADDTDVALGDGTIAKKHRNISTQIKLTSVEFSKVEGDVPYKVAFYGKDSSNTPVSVLNFNYNNFDLFYADYQNIASGEFAENYNGLSATSTNSSSFKATANLNDYNGNISLNIESGVYVLTVSGAGGSTTKIFSSHAMTYDADSQVLDTQSGKKIQSVSSSIDCGSVKTAYKFTSGKYACFIITTFSEASFNSSVEPQIKIWLLKTKDLPSDEMIDACSAENAEDGISVADKWRELEDKLGKTYIYYKKG